MEAQPRSPVSVCSFSFSMGEHGNGWAMGNEKDELSVAGILPTSCNWQLTTPPFPA
jgi:hypothetical protein